LNKVQEPNFIERDYEAIKQRMISSYETKIERTLPDTDPDRLIIEVVAYDIYLLRIGVQDAAKQNLLKYARFPMLDHIGDLKKTPRIGDNETDDAYRDRVYKAPEKFSTCGTEGGYIEHVKAVSESIIDVSVFSVPKSGVADIYVLTKDKWTEELLLEEQGKPEADKTKIEGVNLEVIMQKMIEDVLYACNDKTVRPLTEQVNVFFPEKVEFDISANITLYKDAPPDMKQLIQKLETDLQTYISKLSSKLDGGIVRSQIIEVLQQDGVFQVDLIVPVDYLLNHRQFAICNSITLNHIGVEDV